MSPDGSPAAPFTDAASFVAALREHDDYLRGLVQAVVRDRDAVDDVMQAAYERAYRALDGFDGRSALRTWLHTICYRTAVDHIRYESSRPADSLDAAVSPPPSATRASISGEIMVDLEAIDLLARLDPEQRMLLYLTAGLGHSYDDVAELVGMQRGTVASKVSRAKERLRKGVTS
ncbi:MAG: RNA polymerase sigma factor [Actinomycetota bacterium]